MIFISHRGDTSAAPENTLPAFLSSFEKGADGIELDAHIHNDQVIVVHPFLFDQTKKLPLLEEVMAATHTKGRIEIEIKEFDTDILIPLKKILDNYPNADLELTTSEMPLAPHIKNTFPHIPLGLIFHDFYFQDWMPQEIVTGKLIGWGKLLRGDKLHINYKILKKYGQKSLVADLHKAGFVVHSHILKTDRQIEDLKDLEDWGVDQCTFDDIDLIKK